MLITVDSHRLPPAAPTICKATALQPFATQDADAVGISPLNRLRSGRSRQFFGEESC